MKLTGKKALITGGNSGIGLATARLFIAEGAQVAITGRDQKTLDEAVAELGPNARGYRADITVAEDRKQLFATLAKDFGKLDIVFANAGISARTPTGSTDEAIFEKVIHADLNGAFFTVNSAAPLLNDNGSIIFNGSVHNYLVSVWKRLFQQQNRDLQRKFKHLASLWLVATACDSLRLLPDSGTTWKSVVKKNNSFTGQRESGTIALRGFSLA